MEKDILETNILKNLITDKKNFLKIMTKQIQPLKLILAYKQKTLKHIIQSQQENVTAIEELQSLIVKKIIPADHTDFQAIGKIIELRKILNNDIQTHLRTFRNNTLNEILKLYTKFNTKVITQVFQKKIKYAKKKKIKYYRKKKN